MLVKKQPIIFLRRRCNTYSHGFDLCWKMYCTYGA
jgi:hypothetical protein